MRSPSTATMPALASPAGHLRLWGVVGALAFSAPAAAYTCNDAEADVDDLFAMDDTKMSFHANCNAVDAADVDQDKMVVFFPSTKNQPNDFQRIIDYIGENTDTGMCAVGVKYDASHNSADCCLGGGDVTAEWLDPCREAFYDAKWKGGAFDCPFLGPDDDLDIAYEDSIMGKLEAFLSDDCRGAGTPMAAFRRADIYSDAPDWSKIAVIGTSQGSQIAQHIAAKTDVQFAGGITRSFDYVLHDPADRVVDSDFDRDVTDVDGVEELSAQAYMRFGRATPVDRVRVAIHVEDAEAKSMLTYTGVCPSRAGPGWMCDDVMDAGGAYLELGNGVLDAEEGSPLASTCHLSPCRFCFRFNPGCYSATPLNAFSVASAIWDAVGIHPDHYMGVTMEEGGCSSVGGNRHACLINDGKTPLDADDNPVFGPLWLWLVGEGDRPEGLDD